MKKINFNNVFKKKTVPPDFGKSVAWPVNAIRDWKIVVLIFAVGVIVLSVFALYIYSSNQIGGGYLTSDTVNPDIAVKTLNLKKLEADISVLENKQADFLKLKATRPKLVDPAL